jgi:putative hydrolase of the HAD superfamily
MGATSAEGSPILGRRSALIQGVGIHDVPVAGRRRIRGVLFDSGGVLIRPVGGRWNPRADFEDILLAHHPEASTALFSEAFAAGQRALDAGTTTIERTEYHRIILGVLGIDRPSAALLRDLEAPPAVPVVEVFPDVRPVLDHLQEAGIRMCVVSDNWRGLEAVLRSLGIESYFAGLVISEVLGCNKPDRGMYAAGRRLLGLEPSDCIVVDDDPQLVAAAIKQGHHGTALTRTGSRPASVPAITSLDQLPAVTGCE